MNRTASVLLRITIWGVLLGLSYWAGWQTSVHTTEGPKRVPIKWSTSGSIYVPRGFRIALVGREVTNQGFVPGDRIDVLVQHEGVWSPLVVDALVAREDWQTVALIVRQSEEPLFRKARAEDVLMRYRKTFAPP